MDKLNNNNVLSMRDYLEAKNKQETYYCSNSTGVNVTGAEVIQNFLKMASKLDKNNKAMKEFDYTGTSSEPKPIVSGNLMTIDSLENTFKHLSISSIQDAIHYEYKAQNEVLVAFESKEELFKVLKRAGLGELLRVKYCNLDNPVIKEFFEHIKKED